MVVKRCPHCHARSTEVCCVTCNREMCEDCISYGDAGKVCGLCLDREDAEKRYERYASKASNPQTFDEWYDVNG